MSRILLPFRRLQWQLTLFYIMTTLVAALIVAIATTAASALTPPKTAIATPAEILTNSMAFTEAPHIAAYLEQSPPDQHGLNGWAATWTHGFTFSKQGFRPNSSLANTSGASAQLSPGSDGANDVTILVFDRDGQLVASASAAPSGSELAANPTVQSALRAALVKDARQGPSFKTSILADGRTVACVPVVAYDGGPLLGALLVIATITPGPQAAITTNSPLTPDDVQATIKGALPLTLALVALASVVGTLFGVVASRRITHRLHSIRLAADAWSQGEFHTVVRDTGRDELGTLATDLNTMAQQLQRLVATRQELAVVEERHRLARDLHDSVKQQTFVITMLVGAARNLVTGNEEAEHMLSEAERLAGQTQQELTTLIRTLRPIALKDTHLSTALREFCSDWSQLTHIAVQLDAPDELPVAPNTEQELFRVAQEALANVARHSSATEVVVHACIENECVLLSVRDNGHGFDQDHVSGVGLGLRSMRERVETLGGSLTILSGEEGTRVEARIPVAAHATSAEAHDVATDYIAAH
jgi:NarL family two-component system sensor histidine kinase LiaS